MNFLYMINTRLSFPVSLFCTMTAILAVSGCISIPHDDNDFLKRRIKLGSFENEAIQIIEARGFQEIQIRHKYKVITNNTTHKKEYQLRPIEEFININLGYVRLVGIPIGKPRCFNRNFNYGFARGVRIICWTADPDDKITWRQAGFTGVSL